MTQNSLPDSWSQLKNPGLYGMCLAIGVCAAFAYTHDIIPAAGSAMSYKVVYIGLLLLPLLLVLWAFRIVFGLRAFGYVAAAIFMLCWLTWAYIENTAQASPRKERAEFAAALRQLAASYDQLVQEIAPK
jgi:hypothetical protein